MRPSLFFIFFALPVLLAAQDQYTPYGLDIDSRTLEMSWSEPRLLLIDEDFEEGLLPSGWQALSQGMGWVVTDDPVINNWEIPEGEEWFALTNDDHAPSGNDGSMDYLVLPLLDLTAADSFMITFDAYFDGAFMQSAAVEYSLDNGESWSLLFAIDGSLNWEHYRADLTEYSGSGGSDSILIAFHSDDNGQKGSGFAVDNIKVFSDISPQELAEYRIYLDEEVIDSLTETSYTLPGLRYGEQHSAGVKAVYTSGESDIISEAFLSNYLMAPDSVEVTDHPWYLEFASVIWHSPHIPPPFGKYDLLFDFPSPNVFMDGGCTGFNNHIYISSASSGQFCKMDTAGNILEIFTINGVPGIYDLAHCPTDLYTYGGHGGTTVYKMNLVTQELISTFDAPVTVRALAYDPYTDGFWATNWNEDITLFDREMNVLSSFPPPFPEQITGLACADVKLYAFTEDQEGNLIIREIEMGSWQLTGVTLDVTSISSGTGSPGGLDIIWGMPWSQASTLCGIVRNDVVFGFLIEDDNNYHPDGYMGNNIYDENGWIDFVPAWWGFYQFPKPELPSEMVFYVDAMYNLEEYGYPGDTGYSEKAGPAYYIDLYGNELDLYEDWSDLSFDTNQWTTGSNWYISHNFGNPKYAATFRGLPNLEEYSSSLLSFPLFTDNDTSCRIMLEYDIMLLDDTPTGEQSFDIEIWTHKTQTWKLLKHYENGDLWEDHQHDSIDITPDAADNYFMIRFHAHGSNSNEIDYWWVDNIQIYRHCKEPGEISAIVTGDQENIEISWNHPQPGWQEQLQWCSDKNYTGMGAGFHQTFHAAVRWDTAQLYDFYGASVTQADLFPIEQNCFYTLEIWQGDSAAELIYREPLSGYSVNEWLTVQVDPPVPVDVSKELWVGYSYLARSGYPIALDEGPATDGYGNWLKVNNNTWSTILELYPDIDYNHNIRVHLQKEKSDLMGYELYRSINNGTFEKIATTASELYNDTVTSWNSSWCYKVRALCSSSAEDTVKSAFSEVDCVIPVSLEEDREPSGITIFPNPATDHFVIRTEELISYIRIYNSGGQLIEEYFVDSNEMIIPVNNWKPGLYSVIAGNGFTSGSFKVMVIP